MRQKIKFSLFIRIALLVGPCLVYLTSIFIDETNIYVTTTKANDDFTSRHLLNIEEHDTMMSSRDGSNSMNKSRMEIETIATPNNTLPEDSNCTRPAAILNFPHNGFIRGEQRRNAWIALHVLLSCYCFWLLAIICDEYFIGSIEVFCQKFRMKEDIAGGTIMAMATSSPELFINCVGTFITEGDIGVGTVVGSAVFNILAVPACCGLLARRSIQLEWWSVSRDCIFYGLSVIGLIAVIYDNKIMWYEAACLVAGYGIYLIIMYKNDSMSEKAKILARKLRRRFNKPEVYHEVTEITPLFARGKLTNVQKHEAKQMTTNDISIAHTKFDDPTPDNCAASPWKFSENGNFLIYLLRWPITFILWCTIPDCRRYNKLFIVTFMSCVMWIGCVSYLVAFMITVVDSVMGLTILAAGTSLPEAVSSVIVTAQGYGSMGISNTIGSNTFDILLCLGLPWLVKTLIVPTIAGRPWITLNSTGITYSAISLLTTLFALYFSFVANKFRLDWKIGISCLIFYLLFLIFASLVEMNVFFAVNIPTCDHKYV